ncbi:hypothetical protein BJX61DRAFT_363266 [Aspergillus egyptiacus]|nr:hypothetical protein BJX61DRAFT_363266 [Aspergillus egyptiacus]
MDIVLIFLLLRCVAEAKFFEIGERLKKTVDESADLDGPCTSLHPKNFLHRNNTISSGAATDNVSLADRKT